MKKNVESAKNELKLEVNGLRVWREQLSKGQQDSLEDLAMYNEWPRLWDAFCEFLDLCSPEVLDDNSIDLLLYSLACDEEGEFLKEKLIKRPSHLIWLARHAIRYNADPIAWCARWQLADALGYIDADGSVDELLEKYVYDDEEYVSRRALMALGRRKSPKAEALARRAWETGHEYQRMAALDVLRLVESPLLPSFIEQAHKDGREFLVGFADRIRSGVE